MGEETERDGGDSWLEGHTDAVLVNGSGTTRYETPSQGRSVLVVVERARVWSATDTLLPMSDRVDNSLQGLSVARGLFSK